MAKLDLLLVRQRFEEDYIQIAVEKMISEEDEATEVYLPESGDVVREYLMKDVAVEDLVEAEEDNGDHLATRIRAYVEGRTNRY